MLERECRERGVSLHTNVAVTHVRHGDGFEVASETATFRAPALVIATGGLSIPKIGATGFGYEIARQFGLRVRECRPALVPLTFGKTTCGTTAIWPECRSTPACLSKGRGFERRL